MTDFIRAAGRLAKSAEEASAAVNEQNTVTEEQARQTAAENQAVTLRIINEDEKRLEANTSIAQTSQRRAEAGVFWLELLQDPLGKLQAEVEKYFPGDGPAQSFAKDLLSGLQSGRFDPESSLATYSNSGSPTSYSGASTIAGLSGGTPVASRGMSRSGKGLNGVTDCARNALLSTVATAAKIVVGNIGPSNSSLRAAAAVHQSIGSLAAATDDFVSAMMTLPVETLSLFLTGKNALLDQLADGVDKVFKVLEDFTADDYGYDHQYVIREALGLLQEAESDTSTVERILTQGGNFLEDAWDRAEDRIDDASDLLRDTELVSPLNSKQLRLVGYLHAVHTTLQVLLCRQSIIERLYGNISSFTVDYGLHAKFDNLFGPAVDQVSCMLRAIMDDMEAALNKNSALSYFSKEKEWFLLLRAILTFMKNAKGMAAKAPTASGTADFSASFEADSGTLNNSNDFTALVNLANELKSQARGALTMPISNFPRVKGIVDAIKVEIDRQKAITSEIEERLNSYAARFSSEIMTQAVTVMSGLVAFAKSRNLLGMVKALKEGDLKGLFSSAFESSDEERAMGGLTELIGYARSYMPEEVSALRDSFEVLRGRVRGEDLFKRLISGSADSYIRDQKEKRQPQNSRLKRVADRVNRRLQGIDTTLDKLSRKQQQVQERIDMVSGKIDSTVSQISDVATRPIQDKPVSCASR